MCLGIPAKVLQLGDGESPLPMARISIDGQEREVCSAYLPELEVGDYVLIQNGFAMSILDEASALEALETIAEHHLIADQQLPGFQRRTP